MKYINLLKKDKITIIFISTFIIGILSHGIILFNKLSFHDDLGFNNNQKLWYYQLGRFFLFYIFKINRIIFGDLDHSIPLFNGLLSFLFIALAIYFIIAILKIKNKLNIILICGLIVTFPNITALFGYMFTAPYYMFAFFISTLAAYIGIKSLKFYTKINIKKFILISSISVLFIVIATGIYQCYYIMICSLFLIFLLKKNYEKKSIIKYSVHLSFLVLTGLLLYVMSVKGIIFFHKIETTSYQNINSFGYENLNSYFFRIKDAYKNFFLPYHNLDLFPTKPLKIIYIFILFAILFSSIKYIIYNIKNKNLVFQHIFLILLLPLCINFIIVITGKENLSQIAHQTAVLPIILFFYLLENKKIFQNQQVNRKFVNITLAILIFMIISFSRFALLCYTNAIILQQQAINYFTTLIFRIQNVKNYDPNLPILYINEFNKFSYQKKQNYVFKRINIPSYTLEKMDKNFIINNYAWKQFVSLWCNFNPKYINIENKLVTEKIKTKIKMMPSYPYDGAIEIIDNIIVVKFSN